MNSVSQRLQIAASWIASHLRSRWIAEHYPIDVRHQIQVPVEAQWSARVLNWPGPIGLGATSQQARAALIANLREIAEYRRRNGQTMPRPGTNVPIEFASAASVNSDPQLLDDFIEKALGFNRSDPVYVSDLSTIEDFGDEERIAQIRAKIQEHYGLVVTRSEPVLIADILGQIRAERQR